MEMETFLGLLFRLFELCQNPGMTIIGCAAGNILEGNVFKMIFFPLLFTVLFRIVRLFKAISA